MRQGQPGRRERHKAVTRQRLYDVAMSLFAVQGYDKTSIDDIAEQADVARATVFNYFRRKEEFLDAWTVERQEVLTAVIGETRSQQVSAAEQLRHCMRSLAAINESDANITRTLVRAWVCAGRPVTEEPDTAYIFAKVVADGIARGEIRAGVDAELAGHILRDIYLGTLYRWINLEPDRSFSLRDRLLTSLDSLLEGLAA